MGTIGVVGRERREVAWRSCGSRRASCGVRAPRRIRSRAVTGTTTGGRSSSRAGSATARSPGAAADWWHRYGADLTLAAELGQTAHKLSIEWSRIEKEPGVYDEAALAHYDEMLRAMRDLGLTPYVVLHHFTNPLWLEATGCWENADTPARFARSRGCAPSASAIWSRRGSPSTSRCWSRRSATSSDTGRPSARAGARACGPPRNLMLGAPACVRRSEGGAAATSRSASRSTRPSSSCPHGRRCAERLWSPPADWFANLWFLDRIRDHLDFIGLQYYSRTTVRPARVRRPERGPRGDELPVTDLGWAIYPEGLHNVTRRTWHRYRLPLYITENGIADRADMQRKVFIHDHLRCLHEAIEEGADVRGYFHWSLVDNFEWREGFRPRFGLIEVDYATQHRRVRDSARYYAIDLPRERHRGRRPAGVPARAPRRAPACGAQVPLEPRRRQLRDLLERARLLEQVRRAGHDLQLLGRGEPCQRPRG